MATLHGSSYHGKAVTQVEDTGDIESKNTISAKLKHEIEKTFSKKNLYKRVPFLKWCQEYNKSSLGGDLVAGFTVGLMIIPQALAYGIVAGLSPSYGLYSAFMGCFVYFFLGSTREMNIGPTAIMSLMTLQYTSQGGADYAVLLGLVAGVLELLAAAFKIGFLINFISHPVISGFTSAAAFTIASSQLKSLFGLKLKTKGLLNTWIKVASNLDKTRYQDLTLGLVCIVVLVLMKKMRTVEWSCMEERSKNLKKISKNTLFFCSVGRNAIIVIIASLIAYFLDYEGLQPFTLTGHVESGVPHPEVPPFTTEVNNQTMTFPDIMSDVGVGVVIIPFIAILDHIAIVSAFSKGRHFDATQEIIALGVTNILAAFFRAIPTTGSLSRTAVNLTSGCTSPISGLVTGSMVLLALAFLTPFFRYIPKASLAAVIICAVLNMVDYKIVMQLWRSKKQDLIPLLITFLACMFWGLEWGILLGIGINLIMLLYSVATPKTTIKKLNFANNECSYIIVTIHQGMYYPSTAHIRHSLRKAGTVEGQGNHPVVVDCCYIEFMDYTAAKGLQGTIDEFKQRSQLLIFLNLKPKILTTVLTVTENICACKDLAEVEDNIRKSRFELEVRDGNIGSAKEEKTEIINNDDATSPFLQTSEKK